MFGWGGWGVGPAPNVKMDQIGSKVRDQKDLRRMKKGVDNIENQGEIWYKMLQNGRLTDFGEILPTLGQIISETKCDRNKLIFFTAEKGAINKIELGINKGLHVIEKCQNGSQSQGSFPPPTFKYGSAPPTPINMIKLYIWLYRDMPTLW